MPGYPLGPLLAARGFREDAAAREASKAAAAAARAREEAAAARDELERYRAWRPGEEERLFEKLRGKLVSLGELDRHLGDIQRLRDGELAASEAVAAADKAAAAAAEAAARAAAKRVAAARDKEKIEAHRGRWLKVEAKRLEAAEELELEDFSVRREGDADEAMDEA